MLRVYIKTPGGSWVEYTPVLRPDRSFEIGGRAYNGEADQGEITVDDPDYTLDIFTDIAGHREVKITEDDSGSELILSLGRIGPKSMERGAHPIGREVTITVEDVNAELRGIIVNKFNRPAESGLTRVKTLRLDYLRGSASTSSLARDSTDIDIDLFVPEDDEITMPAKFYDSTTPLDVLRECAEWEGKNFFVYPADNGDKELFYARPNDFSLHQCTLELSDNPNVVDNITVFEPWWIAGPALNMDPLETTTGIQFIHPTGQRTYDNDPAAEALFDKWEESMFVDEAPGINADNHLAAVIVARDHEERRRQCAIRLPGSQAHLVKQGMLITVLRARAAAISSSVNLRIANFRLKWLGPDATDDNAYLAILTLEHPVKLGRHWGGSKPGASSHPPTPRPAPEVEPQPEDTITEIARWTWTTDTFDESDTYDSIISRNATNTEFFATPHGELGGSQERTDAVPVVPGATVIASMDFRWKWSPATRPIYVEFWSGVDPSGFIERWVFESGAGRAVDTVYHLTGTHLVPVGANFATFTWPSSHGLSRVDNAVLGTVTVADIVENPPGAFDYGDTCPHDSNHFVPSDWLACRLEEMESRPASQVPFDDTVTEFGVDNVQEAIEVVDAEAEEVADRVTALENADNGGTVQSYVETVGDGAATSFNVVHGLGTTGIVVELWDLSGSLPVQVSASIEVLDDDTITVDTAPTTVGASSLRVVVHGAPGVSSGGGGGGGFAPSDISDLGLWLDADEDATISFGSGAAVATWADKSGAGRNMTQATGANQPTRVDAAVNGRSIIRFDGTNDRLELASGNLDLLRNLSGATLFVVNQVDSTSDDNTLFWASVGGSANSRVRLRKTTGALYAIGGRRLDGDSDEAMATPPSYSSGTPVIDTVDFDWANAELRSYADGTLTDTHSSWQTAGSTSDTDSQFIAIGRGSSGGSPALFLNGDVCELLVWQRVLTSDERDQVVDYLSDRWLGGNDINVEWAWVGAVRE